jgi:uncharacterized protein DUF2855
MDFLVRRDDLHECRFADAPTPELDAGQVLLGIDRFGLTANNITYAVFGETMSYWSFFPAENGWGRVPVWGFADVAASRHDQVAEGTRVFGYLPPSSHLVVAPDRVGESAFVDTSPHRAELPAAYNRYSLVAGDKTYEQRFEDQHMLLWPLFFTSFLLDDQLGEGAVHDAEVFVLSSASSRTASAAAFLLSRRGGIDVVGLTSPGNVEFVEELGVYAKAVPYGELESIEQRPTQYVDMSGDAGLRGRVHEHFGESLVGDTMVGATHHDRLDGGGDRDLRGPKPTFFFAPDRLRTRTADWGAEGLNNRLAEAWRPYVEWTTGWLEVAHDHGPEAIRRIYLELLEGRTDPSVGHALSLRETR